MLIESVFINHRKPPVVRPPPSAGSVKLLQSFTAAPHLEKIGDMKIRWTHSLADHLGLRDDGTISKLYHHVSVLQLLQDHADSILPGGLAKETVPTIQLPIPPSG